ncbi:transcription elongation factor Spt5 [Candidatus Pacearchaeota archaeon]|nr:transcription elongation factor Spt5 [Candidatus Pacearchaeota archaeon]
MAIGYDSEFDYLEDDDSSNADEDVFAPKIKGSKKQSIVPGEDSKEELESANEDIQDTEESKQQEEQKEEKPPRKFESLIFVIKVTTNKEDKALEMIADKVKKKKIGIYALARPHGLRGYVFLESPDKEHAEEAVFNLPYVRGIIGKTVTYGEIRQMLEPVAADIKIEKNDIIEIISEPFKNEKAKVVRVDKTKGECVVSLLSAVVPIPVTVKLDNIRVIRREELEED